MACTGFPRVLRARAWDGGGRGRGVHPARGITGLADDVVPQGFPPHLRWPVRGQVQYRLAGRGGGSGWHVTRSAAQGGAARDDVRTAAASVPAARSKLGAITAQASQAQFADLITADSRISRPGCSPRTAPGWPAR